MIRPQPFAVMPGIAACMQWNGADRFSAITASHFSGGNSAIVAVCWMPALLTRMSSPPNAARVRRTSPAAPSGCIRSAPSCRTRHAVRGDAVHGRLDRLGRPNPFSMTSAPSRASACAMPRPIPLVDPVTSATRP